MGLKLYEVDAAIEEILDQPEVMDPDTGELLNPMALEQIEGEKERIILHIARASESAEAEGEAIKSVAAKLKKRGEARENYARGLREYIASCCRKGDKFSDECVRVSIQESTSIEITDAAAITPRFKVRKPWPPAAISKTLIGVALKAGKKVKGAKIATRLFAKIG